MPRNRSRTTRTHAWFHRLLRWTLGPFMVWRYRLSSENQDVVRGLKPPYLVIPNHVMTFDPLFVNYFIPDPIYYVASDANFRSPFTSFWLRHVGAVATSKLADDLASLRLMLRLLKQGKLIGIFAEGQRCWDGVSMPIIPSTAKLVKLAKVPVLVSLLKGGYMTLPRWSFHGRRGRVVVEQRLAVTAQEAAALSVDEITERIERALAHDDSEYQETRRVPYVSRRPAESLQLALFYCPNCESLNTMNSNGRRFYCESCGYQVEFTLYYRFRPARNGTPFPVHFRTIREWSIAQNAFLEIFLARAVTEGRATAVFADTHAEMYTGYRLSRLRKQGAGELSLHVEGLRFSSEATGDHFFPWEEVKALNVVYQDQLEFYCRRTLYVFRFPRHNTSAYKYELCSRILNGIRIRAAEDQTAEEQAGEDQPGK